MNQTWQAEHSAKGAPMGTVLYDVDDDLITIKTGPNEWTVYSLDRHEPLRDRDIDADRGDEIVGVVDRFEGGQNPGEDE